MGSVAARQFWVETPGRGAIRSVSLPPAGEDEVLVRAVYSGISRGTESLVFRGEVPPSQYEVMRAPFQEGHFPAPVKYGYASVGVVEESPAADRHGISRCPVFCLHPHQDAYVVPASSVRRLPDDVPLERAVLGANMETAVNAIWDARPTAGDRIAVIGAGVVGLLTAWLCRQVPGTQVTVVDVNPTRETIVRRLGLEFRSTPTNNADLVIHASGHPAGLVAALAAAGTEATVLELSWYGTNPVTLPLGEDFHSRRLTIRSSQVGRIPPDRAARWNYASRMSLALSLLADSSLDALITGESPFEELPVVMAQLSREAANTLCHRIRY